MPDTPSITMRKTQQYNGHDEEWVNTYHLTLPPGDHAGWITLANAIWEGEATFLGTNVHFVGFYGYEAGNESSVIQVEAGDEGLDTGQGAVTGQQPPSETAGWIRWKTPERNSKSKPIYLRNYYHGLADISSQDVIATTIRDSMQAFGEMMADGSLPGGIKKCGPQGAEAGEVKTSEFFTTRELTRRGRRPH